MENAVNRRRSMEPAAAPFIYLTLSSSTWTSVSSLLTHSMPEIISRAMVTHPLIVIHLSVSFFPFYVRILYASGHSTLRTVYQLAWCSNIVLNERTEGCLVIRPLYRLFPPNELSTRVPLHRKTDYPNHFYYRYLDRAAVSPRWHSNLFQGTRLTGRPKGNSGWCCRDGKKSGCRVIVKKEFDVVWRLTEWSYLTSRTESVVSENGFDTFHSFRN